MVGGRGCQIACADDDARVLGSVGLCVSVADGTGAGNPSLTPLLLRLCRGEPRAVAVPKGQAILVRPEGLDGRRALAAVERFDVAAGTAIR